MPAPAAAHPGAVELTGMRRAGGPKTAVRGGARPLRASDQSVDRGNVDGVDPSKARNVVEVAVGAYDPADTAFDRRCGIHGVTRCDGGMVLIERHGCLEVACFQRMQDAQLRDVASVLQRLAAIVETTRADPQDLLYELDAGLGP